MLKKYSVPKNYPNGVIAEEYAGKTSLMFIINYFKETYTQLLIQEHTNHHRETPFYFVIFEMSCIRLFCLQAEIVKEKQTLII